jgi:hypothetical protein
MNPASNVSLRLGEYARRNRQALAMILWLLAAFAALCATAYDAEVRKGATPSWSTVLLTAINWMFGNGNPPGDDAAWVQPLAMLVAPFLLPLLGVLAFVDSLRCRSTLFMRRIWPAHWGKPLVVVVGLGPKGSRSCEPSCKTDITWSPSSKTLAHP